MQSPMTGMRMDGEKSPGLEVLLASIYYLMTHYMRCPDRKVSRAIAEHFRMLAGRGDCDSAILRSAGRRLAVYWKERADAPDDFPATPMQRPSPGLRVKLH